MKKGISVWAFPGDWPLEKIFATAREAGFDGVEVALAEKGELSLESTEEDLDKIRHLALRYGLELYSVASGLYWTYSLTSDDPLVREKAKEIVKKQLIAAKRLACDTILVVPGCVGADFIPGSGIVAYDEAYERALAAMKELSSFAGELGVCIGVENVWNKFLLSPLEMKQFIDESDGSASSRVGAYFDVGNVVLTGYPQHWIRILGSRIKKVHIKDFKKSVGTLDGFVDLLSGDVDYPQVMDALKDIGYDGWITAEVSVLKDFPEEGVRRTSAAMDKILKA